MKQKTKKIIDYTFKIGWWVVFILLFVLITTIVTAKLKGDVPKIFGYSVLTIATPSMGETIPVDTYILVKETSPKNIRKDNIICFYSDDPAILGYPNTHRVEDVYVIDGKYEFLTKGDANPAADPVTAKGDKLIGKYVKSLNGVTWLSKAVQSKGMLIVFGIMFAATAGVVCAAAVIQSKQENQ